MEDPRVQLQAALKEAMKSKDAVRRDVIRMALNAVKQVEIDRRVDLPPEEVAEILQKEAKQRRESIEEKEKYGMRDRADQELAELAILEEYLPQQLSREKIAEIVREAIASTGATSPKEMGKVMSAVMPRVKGLADGKLVNEVVRELLGS